LPEFRLAFSYTQLSTARLSCLPWLPGFFGVLQMLVRQNSLQRQESSLYGHRIRPQAWEPPTSTIQPCASEYLIADSTSGFGCLLLGTKVIGCGGHVRWEMLGCQVTTPRLLSLIAELRAN
jgi:hypothetical protein